VSGAGATVTIPAMKPSRLRRPASLAVPAAVLLALAAGGCGLFRSVGLAPNETDPTAVRDPDRREEPDHVVIQRILVSFEETEADGVTRTREAAERLAQKVYDEVLAGADFTQLVRLNSDDRHGDGSYAIANWGVANALDELPRERVVAGDGRAVAEAAFTLEPGQVVLIPHDPDTNPLGWNIVRRLR